MPRNFFRALIALPAALLLGACNKLLFTAANLRVDQSAVRSVVFDPPHHLAYVLLSGLPISNYRADVTLTPEDGGTRIAWHGEFDQKYPGTAGVMRALIRYVLTDIAKALARRAEQPDHS